MKNAASWGLGCMLALSALVPWTSGGGAAVAAEPASARIQDNPVPELAWIKRSDWTDVKAGLPDNPAGLKAVGDGQADDTAALQAALTKLKSGATLYLPAGTYRITQTLVASSERILGISIIGHGRSTVLVWDGPAGGSMYVQNTGCALSRYVGLTWDGRGRAAVGMDVSSTSQFETEQRFQHDAFLNFTDAGIRMGVKKKVATAETVYDNCYFANCARGIALLHFNYLDHTIMGCEFRNCGVGIYGGKGSNFYARECRFVGSTETDIAFYGEGGSSVRRCTSQGSQQFVVFGSLVAPLAIQDCRVDGWKSKAGAVVMGPVFEAPVLLFDTVFSRPPSADAPVVCTNAAQRLLLSNNRAEGCTSVVAANGQGVLCEIPPGKLGGALTSPEQAFLRSKVILADMVFDVKRDFGAKGDGTVDDTAALQKAIDAARAHGKGALAYLPQGQYAVSATLRLTGADYTVAGSGFGTAIIWKGPAGGTTLEVTAPERLTLENISIGRHDYAQGKNEADIVQSGADKPSSMRYDRIWVYGMYTMAPLTRGFRGVNLGKNDRVYFKEFNGNLRLTDSADATIYLGTTYEGTVVVDGKKTNRSGFLGGGVRLGTCCNPSLWVKDNHSFVFSDFYVESGQQFVRLEGDAALPAGRVVLQGAKFEIDPKSTQSSVEVNNYRGDLMAGTYLYYPGNPLHRFTQTGDAPFALTLWGACFYACKPELTLSAKGTVCALGNHQVTLGLNDRNTSEKIDRVPGIADSAGPEAAAKVGLALDDLRRLGQVEMEFAFGSMFGD